MIDRKIDQTVEVHSRQIPIDSPMYVEDVAREVAGAGFRCWRRGITNDGNGCHEGNESHEGNTVTSMCDDDRPFAIAYDSIL